MATSIISAGDAANLGVQTTGGDDGVLVLRSGAAGAKVDALSIAAVGTGAFVGEVTATGFTGTLDGVLGGGTPAAATVTTFTSNGIDDNADAVAITIDSSENVGIGTATPTSKLKIVGGDVTIAHIAGTSFGMTVTSDASNGFRIEAADPTGALSYQPLITSGSIQILRTNGTEKLRIDASGNVGIGTASPSTKLHVAGDVTVTGDISANNFAGRNRIINPSGIINQRGAQTALGTQNFVDRWQTHSGNSTAVVNGNSVSGYIELDFTTADTSLAGPEYIFLAQKIEGFNSASLLIGTASAKTITISFKHKHTKTGVNSVALRNSANNRFYVFNYTQSVSNTEETHSETITLDTTGTWIGATNGIGLEILFTVLTGPDQSTATAGVWAGSGTLATSTQVNNGDSASNFFRITDVQLEEGTVATELEYRPYGTELALCQRYARPLAANDCPGMAISATAAYFFSTGITMRAVPTLSTSSGAVAVTAAGATTAITTLLVNSGGATNGTVLLNTTTTSGLVAGDATFLAGAARLLVAEL